MVGTRIFLQIDPIMQDGPQDSVRQSIVIFVKIVLRQIDDGVRDAVALNDAVPRSPSRRFCRSSQTTHPYGFSAPPSPRPRAPLPSVCFRARAPQLGSTL